MGAQLALSRMTIRIPKYGWKEDVYEGEFIYNVVRCWRNDNGCEVGGLQVGVECGTMETVRSLILASMEECLGDRSRAKQPIVKRTGPASCWFF